MRTDALLVTAFSLVSCAVPASAQLSAKPEDVNWPRATATFEAGKMTPGRWANVVSDPRASGGKAICARAGTGRASHILSVGWVPVKTDAKYTAAFHLRLDLTVVPDSTVAKVIYPGTENLATTFHMASPLRLESVHRTKIDDPSTESVVQWYLVDAPSQAAVQDYHDYVIRFERPLPGFVGFRVYWFGRAYCSAWIDRVRLLEEPLPSEAEQLKSAPIPSLEIDHKAPTTLVWAGVYNWTYHIPEVIGGNCILASPPDSAAALPKVDAMLFSEVMLGDLSPKKRLLVSEFVRQGGGLVLLGGVCGYGKSHVHQSPLLKDLLPVETTGLWDLRKASPGGMVVKPAAGRFGALNWSQAPRVYYTHNVRLKPGAQVWLTGTALAGGKPFAAPLLVARPFGKGWVVAFLGTPLGDPGVGELPIWEWHDWGRLLTMALNASRGRSDDAGFEKPTFTWDLAAHVAPPARPGAPASSSGARANSRSLWNRPGLAGKALLPAGRMGERHRHAREWHGRAGVREALGIGALGLR